MAALVNVRTVENQVGQQISTEVTQRAQIKTLKKSLLWAVFYLSHLLDRISAIATKLEAL